MFNFISGETVDISENSVVINCGGIGYEIFVSNFTLVKCVTGKQVQLYTHLQVKEDGLTLYGFSDVQEKRMFQKLLTVTGIGAKMAINILSSITVGDLCTAILNNDSKSLTRIKGMGKKTAERVILELRENIVPDASFFDDRALSPTYVSDNEAVSILMALGLSRNEAMGRAKKAVDGGCSSTEEIVNFSLKNAR